MLITPLPTHRLHVDGCSGLVHDQDLRFTQECPRQAEELTLTDAVVLATLCHLGFWGDNQNETIKIRSFPEVCQ